PEVKDCVVVGMERGGNAEPCAVAILRGGDAKLEEIVQRTNQSLAEYQRMRMWVEWPHEDFPRTNTEKPRRNLIPELAQAQLLGQPTAAGAHTPLGDLIARVTGRSVAGLRED